jgi:hypothetical protein
MPALIPSSHVQSVGRDEAVAPMRIVREEELTASEFLGLLREDVAAIKRIRIEPAMIGEHRFGRIVVEYAVPRLRRSTPR